MKLAIVTDDGKLVSQHFGRATYYLVVTIENGSIIESEMREKIGHNHFAAHEHEEHNHENHGLNETSHGKHSQMAVAISDCSIMISGGMGMGAYESMRRLNIQPIVTDLQNIDEIITAYLNGTLVDHTEKLH